MGFTGFAYSHSSTQSHLDIKTLLELSKKDTEKIQHLSRIIVPQNNSVLLW